MKLKRKNKSCKPLLLLGALLGAWAGAACASVEGPSNIVGEVSLVIGKAWVQHPGAERERIYKGMHISVADAIETASGGHVHVRFVDGALVSVRPASLMEVLRYEYDPAQPEQSAVRFDLKEGVLRAISGEAAKNARQNFRLNTPIAAIGVRGTDFVVSASQDALRALVTEGAIVVTRYSSECEVNGFGACNQNGMELAGGIGQVMQLSANRADPVLLPLTDSSSATAVAGAAASSVEAPVEAEEAAAPELYADSVTTRAVNRTIASRPLTQPPEVPPPPPPVIPDPIDFTPAEALTVAEITENRQLLWGRYALSDANERITTVYEPLTTLFAGRTGVSGNNHYSLFRIDGAAREVQPGLGVVGFNLDRAQAQFTSGGVTSLMDVSGGTLDIDFDERRFATTLNLNHAVTGPVNLVDSGRLFAGGIFHSRSDTQVVAGAVTFDGKEAGYFFEKSLQEGDIEGLTLWGRQP